LQDTCNGEIALQKVSFCYPTRSNVIALRSVNITASRGQSIGIVGPSGGGKSTIVQLAERFYDVLAGVVVSHFTISI
jgi:ABC-type multidrug transport system fused ATPase/permease subunit